MKKMKKPETKSPKGSGITKNRKIIAALGAVVLIVLVYFIFSRDGDGDLGANIIGNNAKVRAQDIHLNLKGIQFDNTTIGKFFSSNTITPFTVKFFKFLQRRFRDMDFEAHLRAVEQYLNASMDPQRAAEMFELYKRFLTYEKSLAETAKGWTSPRTPQEAVKYLRNIQDYRRNFFGNDIADVLFGAQVKHQEYSLRKQAIINEKNLYGADKEKQINKLRQDMWGEDAATIDSTLRPYDNYREKLAVYDKDLGELNETDKKAKVREYREQYFTSEVVERLEKVDVQLENEKQAEEAYRAKEQKIMSDPNLNQQEKDEKLQELQNELFGEEAEAFRRRETIRKADEKFRAGK